MTKKLTFSLTVISTAELGTSSMILSLSSTTLVFTVFLDLDTEIKEKGKHDVIYAFKVL